MNEPKCFLQIRKRRVLLATSTLLIGLFILHFTVYGQDKSGFPDGFDAVQAAPKSHKVIFENASYACWRFRCRPTRRCPCIIIAGRVC
jgi:hypothetical protein